MTREEVEESITKHPDFTLIRSEFTANCYGVESTKGRRAFSHRMIDRILRLESNDIAAGVFLGLKSKKRERPNTDGTQAN